MKVFTPLIYINSEPDLGCEIGEGIIINEGKNHEFVFYTSHLSERLLVHCHLILTPTLCILPSSR